MILFVYICNSLGKCHGYVQCWLLMSLHPIKTIPAVSAVEQEHSLELCRAQTTEGVGFVRKLSLDSACRIQHEFEPYFTLPLIPPLSKLEAVCHGWCGSNSKEKKQLQRMWDRCDVGLNLPTNTLCTHGPQQHPWDAQRYIPALAEADLNLCRLKQTPDGKSRKYL